MGQVGDFISLEPQYNQQTTSEHLWLAFDRLIDYDLQFKPQPMLAESWDLASDATQIKLNLQKGVQFHSGRELTSDDVKYSLLRGRDPKVGAGQFVTQSQWFSSIDLPDKYTVVLRSDEPRPLMFDFFEQINMVDQTTLEGPDAKTKVVGTGPFTFVEWVQGDHATFARNKNYWRSGLPYLDTYQVSFLRDSQAMMAQLESGTLDVVRYPTRQDIARLKSDPQYQTILHPAGGGALLLGANTLVPPLDNKLVRQALNYAINRQRYVDTILFGIGKVSDLPWPETSPAYEATKTNQYPFDLDRAGSLLSQAGVSNLSLDLLPVPAEPSSDPFAQMYQNDLASIGVHINVVKLDQAAWADQVLSHKYNGLYFAPQSQLQLSPGTSLTGAPMNPDKNNESFKSDNYSMLVAATINEADPARLKQVYSQLNDLMLDESFAIYLSPNVLARIARSGVHDMTPVLWGAWSFTRTWVD
jgi:peptide/nickel transport system substrate-binding protein